jgi:transposase-like protein
MWGAEDKDHARAAVKAFDALYVAKFPKAVAKITDDVDELLAFYDYPARRTRAQPSHPGSSLRSSSTGLDDCSFAPPHVAQS